MHYQLQPHLGTNTVEGSCIYFIDTIWDEDERKERIKYEIDNCTHDDIFPQNVEGVMRVGSSVDFIEKKITGQADVVAAGLE